MELDWSEQSPHIRTLFRPWQLGDGYDEAMIQAAEARLGIHLPRTLRNFYLAWGRRQDLTQTLHVLLDPDQLALREDALLFWWGDQEVFYWGIPTDTLEEADPPVVIALSGPKRLSWKPSHARLSGFLDDMTYRHAFCPGGAVHGGWTAFRGAPQKAWLEEHWNRATVTAWAFGIDPTPLPTLYVCEGLALWWSALAACEAEALDDLDQRFQITWNHRW